MPNEVGRESVEKRVWVSEWVMTSCQESQNLSSLGNCCFGSGEEFFSTRNKQTEVGEAMRSPSKQNNQSFITQSTSLGVAKAGNLKLDFMAKIIGIHIFGFEDIFRCYRDNVNSKWFTVLFNRFPPWHKSRYALA